jgi:hypothetical protein
MIYFMPIDECSRCGALTPRIFDHRCTKEEADDRPGAELAAELQSWIASQVAAGSTHSTSSTRVESDLRRAIRSEPRLSPAAKRHLIGLVEDLAA